jgi:hypothetical protein
VLTLLVRICRSLTDLQLSPVRAILAHRRAGDASEFERFLGCPIVFGGRADQLVFGHSPGRDEPDTLSAIYVPERRRHLCATAMLIPLVRCFLSVGGNPRALQYF